MSSDVPSSQFPPEADAMLDLALQTVEAFPEPFLAMARQVRVLVEDFADEDTLREMGMEDPFELTGLYDGIPMTEKSVMDQAQGPDTVWLFRRAILDEWIARGDIPLAALVAHVTVHEFAHHFGWSDDDIAAIDPWWE